MESGGSRSPLMDSNNTTFRMGIECGSITMVKGAIAKGADITQYVKGQSALNYAVSKQFVPIIEILIKNGANPYLKDHEGNNAYDLIADRDIHGISKILDSHKKWFVAVKLACDKEKDVGEAVMQFIEQIIAGEKININIKNHRNETALHIAAKASAIEMVELLLAKGVNINVKDSEGKTASDIAEGKVKEILDNYSIEQVKDIRSQSFSHVSDRDEVNIRPRGKSFAASVKSRKEEESKESKDKKPCIIS